VGVMEGGGGGASEVDDAVRNEALKTLTCLTRDSQDVQQIAAFEGAFDRLFRIVLEERGGIGGGVVVQDCLGFLRNLLRRNVATQGLFVESGGVAKVEQLLRLRTSDFDFMTRQKQDNLAGAVALCAALCWDERDDAADTADGEPSGDDGAAGTSAAAAASAHAVPSPKEALARRQGRQALFDSGCFAALLPIALSRIPAPAARSAALHCVAAMLDGDARKAALEASSVRLNDAPLYGDEPDDAAEDARRRRGPAAVEANAVARACRVAVFSVDGDESAAACRVVASWCREKVESQLQLAATLVPRPSSAAGEFAASGGGGGSGGLGVGGGLGSVEVGAGGGGKPGRAYDDRDDVSLAGVGPMVLAALAECDASTGEGVLRARAAATVLESILRGNVAAKELALRAVPEMAGVVGPAGRAGLLPLVVACLADTSRKAVSGDLGTRQGGARRAGPNPGIDNALCAVALGRLLLTWLYDCPAAVAAFVEEGGHLPLLLDAVVVRPSASAMSLAEAERAAQMEKRKRVQESKRRWSRPGAGGSSMSDLSLLMGRDDTVGGAGATLWDGTVADPPVWPVLGATDAKQQLAGLCALLLGCCIMYNDCVEVSRRVVLDLVCSRVGLHGFAQAWAGLESSHAISHPRDAQDGWCLFDAGFGDWAGRFMAEVNAQIERMYAGGQSKGGAKASDAEVDIASLSADEIRDLVVKNRELTHQLLNVGGSGAGSAGGPIALQAKAPPGAAGRVSGEALDALRSEISSLRAELARAREESEAARAEATRSSGDLMSLSEAYNALDGSYRVLQAQIEQLNKSAADRGSEADRRAAETSKAAEGRAEAANGRASEAEVRATDAEQRAADAEQRAADAEQRAGAFEQRAGFAEGRVGEVQGRVEEAESRARDAEARADEADIRAADAEGHVKAFESRVRVAEERVSQLELELSEAISRGEDVDEARKVAESDLEDLLEVVGEQEKVTEAVRAKLAAMGMDVESIFNLS